jgi:isopentenyl diphosphate isomerase/L-lactate dehydrogenase-like FMN-dependent dehydrogenase
VLNKYKLIEIENIHTEKYFGLVYDLEVQDDHSYNIDGIVVHNSGCTTRKQTGVGIPQLSAIIDCANVAHGLDGHIIGDGGITMPGDASKAFGGGADFYHDWRLICWS